MFLPSRIVRCLSVPFLFAGFLPGLQGTDPFDVRMRHGRQALEKGDAVGAAEHFQRALVLRPDSVEVLAELFLNAAGEGDDRVLWGQRLWNAACDERGKPSAQHTQRAELLELLPGAPTLSSARIAAVAELEKLCSAERKNAAKDPANGLIAAWAAELGGELARPIPELRDAKERAFAFELEADRKQIDHVIKTLKRVHSRAASNGEHSTAVRAARIARGLAAQGAFEDLQGPAPSGISALSRWAVEALDKSRLKLDGKIGAPLSIEELENMEEDERREFSRVHADLSFPGVAHSARDFYRIETCCGHETLLGVAETVEYHHDRLVRWYGQDPFKDRQGLMRILPEAAGLESEGSGFWWAGGFQGGDTTTLRFSCGTIEGLGHLITHELTHRFDGALFPGTPAWLAEGKAVWTGGSFGSYYDEEFVEDHISFGTVESAWMKGYGGEQKLRDLITGEIEDYRDNYVAGYALYVYLKLWKDASGAPVFAERLEAYMRGLADRNQKPEAWFSANFADGKQGRPTDFAAFAVAFQEFLAGFYWDDRAEWTSRYTASVEQAGGAWVYDAPTWTWSRNRAEPYWGQDHAWRAGDLFLDLEKNEDAAQAYLWAWTVDERTPRRMASLARVLESIGEQEAAWVLRNDVVRYQLRSAEDSGQTSVAPFNLPRTREFLGALAAEAANQASAGRARAAAALWADHDELASWLGEPVSRTPAPPVVEKPLHPWDEPAALFAVDGWGEEGLTGFEERRNEGCWYAEPDGDLHVGRFRPRESTGVLDRKAHNRHAFALARAEQLPGRYAIRCQVQFTTSFASGALVLGYTRRDRNLRFSFSAGDFYYSIGKKEQGEEIESVGWRVSGLRDRDGPLTGSVRAGSVGFDSPRSSFSLQVIVDGAAAHFWIEDQYLGSYHDALGTPIAGRIGFATGMGAIRVVEPTVQRLDRSRQLGLPLTSARESSAAEELRIDAGLDLHAPTPTSFRHLINRPVAGMIPDPTGTILVWIPMPEWDEAGSTGYQETCVAKALKLAESARDMMWRVGADQPLLFALPDKLDAATLESLKSEIETALEGAAWSSVIYRWEASPPAGDMLGQHRSWLCFVDSAGILRFCDRFYSLNRSFPDEMVHWITVFRDDDGRR